MKSLGLQAAGYKYMNVDDCWSLTNRDANGHIIPDPEKWPNGISGLSQKLHDQGFKFGLFSAAGIYSCDTGAGSLTYEQIDA